MEALRRFYRSHPVWSWVIVVLGTISALIPSSDSDSDSAGDKGKPQTQPAKPPPKNGTLAALIACVKSSGYSVERRDRNLIAVTGDEGQELLIVERMPSHAEAVTGAKAAT